MTRAIVVLAVALLVGGCGLFVGAIGSSPDDLSDWSRVPLPADPTLNAEAQRSCGGDAAQRPLLFQDRRTPQSAIVVFGDAAEFAMCSVSRGGGSGFGSSGADIGVPAGPLTIGVSGGNVGSRNVTVAEGIVEARAATVAVVRVDGVVVEASLGGRRWLAWWPGDIAPVTVIAYDAAGAELARAEASR